MKVVSPELINRIAMKRWSSFNRLQRDHMDAIADIGIAKIADRLQGGQHMEIDISDAAKACVAESGFDVRYGARPLKRALVKELLNPLSRLVLEGSVQEGDTVRVRTRGEALQLQKKGEAELGWASGSSAMSENKNDVVVLKNHEGFSAEEDDESASEDEADDWLNDDLHA
mmetsp:Transcript_37632/g.91339  ORF Transcript_37632/g.91339 Transcript_37632/m.91339 type:complete len:171 (+) Transcript_37632:1601-2113(+)